MAHHLHHGLVSTKRFAHIFSGINLENLKLSVKSSSCHFPPFRLFYIDRSEPSLRSIYLLDNFSIVSLSNIPKLKNAPCVNTNNLSFEFDIVEADIHNFGLVNYLFVLLRTWVAERLSNHLRDNLRDLAFLNFKRVSFFGYFLIHSNLYIK